MVAKGPAVVYNRVESIMAHTSRYAFKGKSRLAADAGVAPSNISRLLSGNSHHPSYRLIDGVARALSNATNRTIEPPDFISYTDTMFPQSVCELVGCSGCLPDEAYDDEGNLRPEFADIEPGTWSKVISSSMSRNEAA